MTTQDVTRILRVGETFADKFRVCEYLGGGSYGEVYRIEHLVLRKELALKVLRPELAGEEDLRNRFLREIRIAMEFVHEGAVAIREPGEEKGLLYYTMDLVHGVTLEKLLNDEGALDPTRVIFLADQVLLCLKAAHDRGILHRDIKPANLMVESGEPAEKILLIDFGVARIFQDSSSRTTTASLVGSPGYLAPEWARGKEVDGRADLYAIACVIYRMLCGRPPFEAPTARELLVAHLSRDPELPSKQRPELGTGFDEVIMRGMAKDPNERYPDAGHFRDALRALVQKAPTLAMSRGVLPKKTTASGSNGATPSNGSNGSSRTTNGTRAIEPVLAAPRSPERPSQNTTAVISARRKRRSRGFPWGLVVVPLAVLLGAILAGWNPLQFIKSNAATIPSDPEEHTVALGGKRNEDGESSDKTGSPLQGDGTLGSPSSVPGGKPNPATKTPGSEGNDNQSAQFVAANAPPPEIQLDPSSQRTPTNASQTVLSGRIGATTPFV